MRNRWPSRSAIGTPSSRPRSPLSGRMAWASNASSSGASAYQQEAQADLRVGQGVVSEVVGLGLDRPAEVVRVGNSPCVPQSQSGAEAQLERGGEAVTELEVDAEAGVVDDIEVAEAETETELEGGARDRQGPLESRSRPKPVARKR